MKLFQIAAIGLTSATLLLNGVSEAANAQSSGVVENPAENPAAGEAYRPEEEYDQFMRLGFDSFQAGDYADAANYFRAALYAVPQDREATTAYWNAVNELQSYDVAGQAAVYEENMEAGYDATEASDYEQAIAYFQSALEIRPNDYYAAQALRNVYTYLNRGENADSPGDVPLAYNVYAGEAPYDRYMRLGYAAAQREDFSSALTYFRSALYERNNDRQATIAYWNAVDGLRDGEFGTDQNPESAYDRYMRLGYDATSRGNYTQAIKFFDRALGERPDDGYALQAIRNVETYTSGQ